MPINFAAYIFFWGFSLGLLFIYLLKNLILKFNFLNRDGIPLVGGIAITLSFLVSAIVGFSLLGKPDFKFIGIIFASLLMLFFGILDDWHEFSVSTKFIVQIIAAFVLVFCDVRTRIMYIGNFFNIAITVLWLVGIANAFNHLDIIDGLCGTIGIISSLSFFIIALLNADKSVAVLTLVLTGGILSFLMYNLPPAKIYLGNAGSHCLGFILAAIAMMLSYAPAQRKVALLTPLLVLGLPIYDTGILIIARLKNKRSIFKKSNDHLLFRFLELGWSKVNTLMAMSLLGILFSFSGIILSHLSQRAGILLILFVIYFVVIIGKILNTPPKKCLRNK